VGLHYNLETSSNSKHESMSYQDVTSGPIILLFATCVHMEFRVVRLKFHSSTSLNGGVSNFSGLNIQEHSAGCLPILCSIDKP
jgi:hypothetical protein